MSELIAPAGSFEKMRFAFKYGADAVYMGLPGFSLRSMVNKMSNEEVEEAINYAHSIGKKVYVTVNIYPHSAKLEAFKAHFKWLAKVKPDAIILADPGVLMLAKEHYPDAKIHVSVQANSVNYKDVEFWAKQGASRVILSRELTVDEIKEIKDKNPGVEIECFVHGAICVAQSGRCLISNYLTNRDPNQGSCAQSCRWNYKVHVEEQKREGEFMPMEEDEHGSYLFNAKDLCGMPYVKDMVEAGVDGFKLEGRSKSVYYLSSVCKMYKKALEAIEAGTFSDELKTEYTEELLKIGHRDYSPGFLKGAFDEDDIYYNTSKPMQTYKFMGIVREHKKGLYRVEVRNRIFDKEKVEIMTPDGNFDAEIKGLYNLEEASIEAAHGGAGDVLMRIDGNIPDDALIRMPVNEND